MTTLPPELVVKHPAKFTDTVYDAIAQICFEEIEIQQRPLTVLDPFAGTGRIHRLGEGNWLTTWGVELEPEWATQHPRTVVGDATSLPFGDETVEIIATSPCYGNRMADTYDGRDGSRRMTYRLALGRDLSKGSAAGMQWGPSYRALHERALNEMLRVLCLGGLGIINMSNHIRGGDVQLVVEWWTRTVIDAGVQLISVTPVGTDRYRHGANHELRVEAEHLITFRKISPYVPTLF